MTATVHRWQTLCDADNPENRAAGNRSDWLKHTIWLAGLHALQQQQPHTPLQLHSCHAGRGMYRISSFDPCVHDHRRHHLQALWRPSQHPLPLQIAQREVCATMDVNHTDIHWYAGSALLCQWWRQHHWSQHSAAHHYLYEWHPDTRAVLAASLAHYAAATATRRGHILARDTHGGGRFDGETEVARSLSGWPTPSVLLLDPFGLWRHPKHQQRRQRFHTIFEAIAARGARAPAVSLFFAWGKAGAPSPQRAGERTPHYWALRRLARNGAHALMEMHWYWDLQCSMWWLLPTNQARRIAAAINQQVEALLARLGGDLTSWNWRLSD